MCNGNFPTDYNLKITLEQSIERERLVAKVAELGIWEYDADSQMVYLDDRGMKIYGIDRSSFDGTLEAWISLLHPDDRQSISQRMLSFHNSTSETLTTVIRILSPTLGVRFIHLGAHMERDENGNGQRMFGVVRDVSDERVFQQRLQERAQHMQSVIDSMFDCVVVIDAGGTITSFNPAAESVFGRLSRNTIGRNVAILMPNPHSENHDRYLSSYLSGAEPQVIGRVRELEGIRKNGEIFPLELTVTEFDHSSERGFVGVIRDLTERKRVDRMKMEFVSTVSHELRTPLTSISGALSLMKGGVAGPVSQKAAQLLDNAIRNTQRLTRLIQDLLDIEKLTFNRLKFDLQTHPVEALLRQAIESNNTYAERNGISLSLVEPIPDICILVDDGRFTQIMSNFISNAVKFSPLGETVSISASQDGQDLVCSVSDNGPGIPDTFKERLFVKFSQVDSSDTRNKSGTGLGLAISKELAVNMNGSVNYSPETSGGSRFSVRFPLASDHRTP